MKQINKNTVCYRCLGCNKLELEDFKGTYKCQYATIEQIDILKEAEKKNDQNNNI